nr:hypothetical protein [Armatimonas sp.]
MFAGTEHRELAARLDAESDVFLLVLFTNDERMQPLCGQLHVLREKEVADMAIQTRSAPSETYPVFSKPMFETALRQALKFLDRTEGLMNNPLLRSRVVAQRAQGSRATARSRAAVLQRLVLESAIGLQGHPKRERAYRALLYTYLRPASTQEKAAEILDLPFSTYRRHLAEGITLISETLWLQESEQW